MPGVEDFGIVPVEAQVCGAPVIATGRGGALDSVRPGTTGHLVPPSGSGLVSRWAVALREFAPSTFDGGGLFVKAPNATEIT